MHNLFKLKIAVLFGVLSMVLLSLTMLVSSSGAEVPQTNWPWSAGSYTIHSSTPISSIGESWCSSLIFQQKEVAGLTGAKDMCMMSGGNVQFGLYRDSTGFEAAVSLEDDSKMHKIFNICDLYDECLYLAGTDTLVRKEYLTGTSFRSLVVYKNFKNRLNSIFNPINLADEYVFDGTNPDYIFNNDNGTYAWLIGGRGASTNGKWLALEFYNRGIGLLNIETLQMKRVHALSFNYSAGSNPSMEFAVSNDGAHIAMMGRNVGLRIVDITPNCGDIPTNANMYSGATVINACKDVSNYYGFIERFKDGLLPKFSDDGNQLSFVATSENNTVSPRQVVLNAFNYVESRLDYLAIGDSYSSGQGETDDNKYIVGANTEHEKCHTSTRSYPFLISEAAGINQSLMKSVACSGARTVDVVGSSDTYMGQGNRLGIGHLNLNNVDLLSAKTFALSNFLPGRILQSDFVGEYKPKAITVGIGGNDAGFMEKLTACLSPTTCKWAATAKGKEQTVVEIKKLFNTLVDTYTQIHKKSLNSKIYAIGYPKIIKENGQCGGLVGVLFDKTEREFITETTLYINKVVSAAAGAAGVKYVDIYDSFGEHALCGLDRIGAINAVALGDDIGLLGEFGWLRFIGSESFHPNPLGHSLTASTIIKQIGNIMTYDHCGGATICPNGQTSPEPASALLPSGYHGYPEQKNVSFASVAKPTKNRAAKMSNSVNYKISLPDNSFDPGLIVDFQIDNQPDLGQMFISSETGSLEAEVAVPDDMEELYLVLHLIGPASGKTVDYYQTIRYFMPDYVGDEDSDDDGNEDDIIDIIASIYGPNTPFDNIPTVPVTPPTGGSGEDKAIEIPAVSPDLPVIVPGKVIIPTILSPLVDDGEINSEISNYQKSATQELAIATSNPEVKGATTTAKSVVKPVAKNNNFLRDWLIPRLGYGLLVAVIFALIIIKFKKLRKLKK